MSASIAIRVCVRALWHTAARAIGPQPRRLCTPSRPLCTPRGPSARSRDPQMDSVVAAKLDFFEEEVEGPYAPYISPTSAQAAAAGKLQFYDPAPLPVLAAPALTAPAGWSREDTGLLPFEEERPQFPVTNHLNDFPENRRYHRSPALILTSPTAPHSSSEAEGVVWLPPPPKSTNDFRRLLGLAKPPPPPSHCF